MADEVLKNWVALLEFKVDQNKATDLLLNVRNVSTAILGIAAAVEAASLALKAMVFETSKGVDEASYIAERAHGTVKDLDALRFAASQTGSSFEDADASIEGFTKKWRNNSIQNTVHQVLLNSGMSRKEIDALFTRGNLFEIMRASISAINKMPTPAAREAYRDLIGVRSNLNRAGPHEEEFEKWSKRSYERQKDIDPEKLTENSRHLQEAWKDLWSSVDHIQKRVTEELSPFLTEQVRALVSFMDSHAQEITKWLKDAVLAVTDFGKELVGQFKPALDGFKNVMVPLSKDVAYLLDTFDKLTGATNRWQGALEIVLGLIVGRWFLGIKGVLATLLKHPVIIAVMIAYGLYADPVGTGASVSAVGDWLGEHIPGLKGASDALSEGFEKGLINPIEKGLNYLNPRGATPGGTTPTPKLSGSTEGVNPVQLAMVNRAAEIMGDNVSIVKHGGFRTFAENLGVLGAADSLHKLGYATDLQVEGHPKADRAYWTRFNMAMAQASKEFGQPYRWGGRFGGRFRNDNNHFDITRAGPTTEALRHLQEMGEAAKKAKEKIAKPASAGPAAGKDNPAPAGSNPSFGTIGGMRQRMKDLNDGHGLSKPHHESMNRYSFGQTVAVNVTPGNQGVATKTSELAGPVQNARLLRNTKGATA